MLECRLHSKLSMTMRWLLLASVLAFAACNRCKPDRHAQVGYAAMDGHAAEITACIAQSDCAALCAGVFVLDGDAEVVRCRITALVLADQTVQPAPIAPETDMSSALGVNVTVGYVEHNRCAPARGGVVDDFGYGWDDVWGDDDFYDYGDGWCADGWCEDDSGEWGDDDWGDDGDWDDGGDDGGDDGDWDDGDEGDDDGGWGDDGGGDDGDGGGDSGGGDDGGGGDFRRSAPGAPRTPGTFLVSKHR